MSLRICTVSPEPPLLAHTGSESSGTFRQKARSVAPLNGWTCAVKMCHEGMLEDTNSLDGAQLVESQWEHHVNINAPAEFPMKVDNIFFIRFGHLWLMKDRRTLSVLM